MRSGGYQLVQAVGRGVEPFSLETAKFEFYELSSDPLETGEFGLERSKSFGLMLRITASPLRQRDETRRTQAKALSYRGMHSCD